MQNAIGRVLAGRRVAAVGGGGWLDITLDGPVTVRVAHEFVFATPTEVDHFFPALTLRPSGALLGLVGRTLGAARVTMAGGLELAFDGDAVLSVPPHAQVAPWSVVTPEGTVCAGLAGGEVAWAGDQATPSG
ncbi:hypothetical protein J5Y04_15140 [Kitasatospora sp. RG8]|uniref:DUF6188 family protein n=1 Tax=Kitasatospora sp. RG8 TaxID=2820815 RepID=UPI001AE0521E|nr:DUF6188 family protein [Kitasatospora sp. RG8]MBP0450872.1 hypothetical protein [Kitasatospora sp. RG8]